MLLDRLRSLQTQNAKLLRLLEFRHGSNASKIIAAFGSAPQNLEVNVDASSGGELIGSAVSDVVSSAAAASALTAPNATPNPLSEHRFLRRPSRLVRTPLREALPTPR